MTPTPHTQPFHVQLLDLTLIQLANWRWSWRGLILTSIAAPLMGIAGLSLFANHRDPRALAYILTGNMVMSLLFGTFDRVAGHFAYMRLVGRLDFFATLPIYRVTLTLATVFAFLALSLPAVLLILVAGTLILDVSLSVSPWLVVVLPLIGVTMCGLGVIVGIVVPTPEEAGSLSSLITFLLVGFGPVIVPVERLPRVVQILSYLSPATYAASALRRTVLGVPDRLPFSGDVAVLAAIFVLSLWVIERRMDWRGM